MIQAKTGHVLDLLRGSEHCAITYLGQSVLGQSHTKLESRSMTRSIVELRQLLKTIINKNMVYLGDQISWIISQLIGIALKYLSIGFFFFKRQLVKPCAKVILSCKPVSPVSRHSGLAVQPED